ncbi:aldehyde dehydrogenase family protein [Metallosphaera hakonensis]|uniref:Aldehyde dehydrogenase n=2 Tax=Metallosphaera hakonensis TaxID=79601 RepID=A0A2U9IWG6_9CREN|nr:aldehyde dehydrogenase family protein [Metallosphaera hakonensis]AWS00303.1 aldehyde dehydrogenase family protein [Metallosphaera hakonensis JCM 8857 = DSM 7519]
MDALIGNSKVSSDKEIEVKNPVTGEVIDVVPSLSRDDIKRAIEEAYMALDKLANISMARRSKLLLQIAQLIRNSAQELAVLMTKETGRPIRSSKSEIERTAQIFEMASSELRRVFEGRYIPLEEYEFPPGNEKRMAIVTREPVGVVGAITPFNFPAASFAHKVAPALAVGNSVVFKPSSLTPLTQLKLGELVSRVFPSGTLNVVTGDSQIIGDELVMNPKVSLITFTGSVSVGLDLASKAVRQGKRSIMELGGSDAEIILEDADLNKAAKAALIGRYDFAGQFCNATKRLIVRKEIEKGFTAALKEELMKLKMGDPFDEQTDYVPLISKEAKDRLTLLLEDAERNEGEILYLGNVPDKGNYFPPVLLRLTPNTNSKVLTEEVFGPILPMVTVDDDDEAIEVANSSEYGLDASIFTGNFNRAFRIASRLKVGTVILNDTTRLRWDNLPFGGVKKSGIGRESVIDTMIEMTETKVIVYNYS